MSHRESDLNLTIDRLIRHEEEKDYYIEVPFTMPDRTEELHVEIEVEPLGEGRTTIDLGLKDPTRIRGWTGGARKRFFVGREKATPGYLPGDLTPGPWAVLLGAYRVPQAGCRVRVHIRCQREARRWLKGDLHTHTVHSDGTYTLEDAANIMEALGCDFIATTDHNTVSQNYAHPRESNIVFIPGMELTTNRGHANFLGAVDPIEDFRAVSMEDIHQHVKTGKARGAKVVLNHPYCDDCPWEWSFEVDYDWVEVWNGPWTERNRRALDWWQAQLAAGRRLVAVGGSDVHRPHPYVKHAMPTTWVYASARTVQGILDAIGRGHVFLSYAPEGPTIEMTIGSSVIGDCFERTDGERAEASVKLTRLVKGDKVKMISDQGTEEEWVAENDGELVCTWHVSDRKFYRIEVWRYFDEVKQTLLAALSNPIYIKSK